MRAWRLQDCGTGSRVSYLAALSRFDVSSPTVVEKIRQLSRLETVEYSLDKIVEGERQSAYLPDFLAGEKLLLVAHGEVIAGIDLGQMKAGDVVVNGDAVHVRLPAAQILTTRIDNGRTRVYSRTTGLLVASDPNLESQVRLTAEQQIAQAALDDGILDKARQNARTSVTALLYGLGFRTVDVSEAEIGGQGSGIRYERADWSGQTGRFIHSSGELDPGHRPADRLAPIGDRRHLGGVDFSVGHCGEGIESACNFGVSRSGFPAFIVRHYAATTSMRFSGDLLSGPTTIFTGRPNRTRQSIIFISLMPRNWPRSILESFGCVRPRTLAACCWLHLRSRSISPIFETSCAFTSISSASGKPSWA